MSGGGGMGGFKFPGGGGPGGPAPPSQGNAKVAYFHEVEVMFAY